MTEDTVAFFCCFDFEGAWFSGKPRNTCSLLIWHPFDFSTQISRSTNPVKNIGLYLALLQLKDYFYFKIILVQIHKSQDTD